MNSKRAKLLSVISASLVLHALLLYVLTHKALVKSDKHLEKIHVNEPIKAHLFFPAIVIIETPKEKVSQPPVPPTPATLAPLKKPLEPPTVKETDITLSKTATHRNNKLRPNKSTTEYKPPPLSVPRRNATTIAKEQLRILQQGQVRSLSEQAAKGYQQQQTSPKLTGKAVDPFITEDEKLWASTQVRVNCSGSANQAASLLSGLFGGTLTCSKPPALKGFIEARLNKSRQLPAKYKPEEGQ